MDGAVWCWGQNAEGQLGTGDFTESLSPTASLVNGATEVGAGVGHTCARLLDRSMRCWGRNGNGELGVGSIANSNTPVTPIGIGTVAQISLAGTHTCVLDTMARVFCWGENVQGQLGVMTMLPPREETPVRVTLPATPAEVRTGAVFTCVRHTDLSTVCFGANLDAQFGMVATGGWMPQAVSW
jgi:alpha-tubulin suppressor-like RCC1 family protein